MTDDFRERKPRPHFKSYSHKVGESSFTLTVFTRWGGGRGTDLTLGFRRPHSIIQRVRLKVVYI